MGCFSRSFKCITCGLGPGCREKIKSSIHYNRWHLKWQIVFAVSVFLLGLQITMQAIAQIFFRFLIRRISEVMVNDVNDEIKSVFIGQSTAIEQNINKMILIWDMQLTKLSNMVETALNISNEGYFGAKYPLRSSDVILTTYDELESSEAPYTFDL